MNRMRLLVVAATLVAVAVVVVGRLVQVMVVDHQRWTATAERQQQAALEVEARRGAIRTADGYLLATSVERLAIQVDTKAVVFPALFASAAAPILGVEPAEVTARLSSGPRSVWLAQRVEPDVAEKVRTLDPSAVVLVPDALRVYPMGQLAAPILGFVGREELRTLGRSGLEHALNEQLSGEPARYLAVKDAVQRQVRLERLRPGRPGEDITLTVNARLQARCEQALEASLAGNGGRMAAAVVLDVASGHLVALASAPSFDPAQPGADASRWRLAAVQDALEPGSTVKPLIAAAALAAGVVGPGELFDCRHGVTVGGRVVRDHAAPGSYTVDEIIAHSSNTGAILLATRVDADFLWQAFAALGFGRRPGTGFPGETAGLLPPTSGWSGLSKPSFALGQELTASPLQMAVAYAAIANGGWLVEPQLLAGEARPSRRRVFDAALAARLQLMLEQVVTDGTGTAAALTGIRVAGKTGTAQRAVAGGFDDRHHAAWFAGFLPLPAPRYAIVVVVDEPQGTYWATSVAAPLFHQVAEAASQILGLVPDPPPPSEDEDEGVAA